MADVPMKTCAKCGKTKKETDFYKIPNKDELIVVYDIF